MSDIYGPLTAHPQYPIEDPRHFTTTIRAHDFEASPKRRDAAGQMIPDPFCARCGYHIHTPIHPAPAAR